MIVLDANILLYAYDTGATQHLAARRYLETALSMPEEIGLPLQSVLAFLRLSTMQGILKAPYSAEEAVAFVDSWFAQPHVRLLVPTENHWPILKRMVLTARAAGPLVTDAEIAALTIEHDGVLQTNDGDFACFPGLRWENPLVTA